MAVWLALHPAPFTMHVVDEAGRAAAGVRRICGVAEGPDGALYVITDRNDAKIVRLVPKK